MPFAAIRARIGPGGIIVLASVLTALLFALATYPGHWAKRKSGDYFDIDSMMRLVEVRDIVNGRGWYDPVLTQVMRPEGVAMHWSRLVDGPVAGLMALFRPLASAATAETIALTLWPFGLMIAFFALQARIAMRLAGPKITMAALLPALVIAATADWSTHHFLIGNIDHHGAMIVLVLALLALAPSLAAHRGAAIAAGVLVAMIPAVAIEGVPYAVAFLAWAVFAWVIYPARFGQTASLFYGAIAVAGTGFFALLVGPERYSLAQCDVYSLPYAAVLAGGGVGMVAVTRIASGAKSMIVRLGATIPVAALALGVMALTGAECFGGPYHMISPDLQAIWLDRIVDARSLGVLFFGAPMLYSLLLLAPLVALGATIWFTVTATGDERANWWLVLVMLVAGLATMFIQLRGLMFVAAFAVAPCAVLVTRLRPLPDTGRVSAGRYAAWMAAWLGSFAILHYAFIPTNSSAGSMQQAVAAPTRDGLSAVVDTDCMLAASHEELAALDPAVVLSMPGLGVPILLHTPHRIWAATFHRFGQDIVDSLAFFTAADPRQAAAAHAGAYLAVCMTSRESRVYSASAQSGLITQLMAGNPPSWLLPISLQQNTALRIYRIVAPGR